MMRWYVAYTQPNGEWKAVAHLRRQGFEAYLPLCRAIRRHARRKEVVRRPLFPRYVFVGFDLAADRWRAVNGTIGISRLVCRGERPAALPDDMVATLRAREDAEGVVSLTSLVLFDPGARLRVPRRRLRQSNRPLRGDERGRAGGAAVRLDRPRGRGHGSHTRRRGRLRIRRHRRG